MVDISAKNTIESSLVTIVTIESSSVTIIIILVDIYIYITTLNAINN